VKTVLFCGGLGTRMREYSQILPKPLADIRQRPILWYVMKYYAHYGFTDFVLCLGYKADLIRAYFEHFLSGRQAPYCLPAGGASGEDIALYGEDIPDWKITFVDTGVNAGIGDRLRSVEPHIGSDALFMANYSDGVTDLHLPSLLTYARAKDRIGTFVAVQPNHSFHTVSRKPDGEVIGISDLRDSGVLINGGYFVLKREIFRHLNAGEELVVEAFDRLIAKQQLVAYHHTGYWACMDTFKDKTQLEKMLAEGRATWQVWDQPAPVTVEPA
jgi:glucose-1-phosphate cytidylyltransferase